MIPDLLLRLVFTENKARRNATCNSGTASNSIEIFGFSDEQKKKTAVHVFLDDYWTNEITDIIEIRRESLQRKRLTKTED